MRRMLRLSLTLTAVALVSSVSWTSNHSLQLSNEAQAGGLDLDFRAFYDPNREVDERTQSGRQEDRHPPAREPRRDRHSLHRSPQKKKGGARAPAPGSRSFAGCPAGCRRRYLPPWSPEPDCGIANAVSSAGAFTWNVSMVDDVEGLPSNVAFIANGTISPSTSRKSLKVVPPAPMLVRQWCSSST